MALLIFYQAYERWHDAARSRKRIDDRRAAGGL
jgi:hypothetical protein